MGSPQDRIDSLIRLAVDGPDDLVPTDLLAEVAAILHDHPDLDGPFLDRYVTRHADEWELQQGLDALRLLSRLRAYDHTPLVALLHRGDVHVAYKRAALFCLTQLAGSLDERTIRNLLDGLTGDLYRSAVHKTLDALSVVGDRGKAGRLLRLCLRATDTPDDEERLSYLDTLVNRTAGNEDIFVAALREPLAPHEVVLLAVSLLREEWPSESPYRTMAEQAAMRSPQADDYLNFYVGVYVAE